MRPLKASSVLDVFTQGFLGFPQGACQLSRDKAGQEVNLVLLHSCMWSSGGCGLLHCYLLISDIAKQLPKRVPTCSLQLQLLPTPRAGAAVQEGEDLALPHFWNVYQNDPL